MDETRFDAWTRRKFGLVTGGAIASLLGLAALPDTEDSVEAAKRHRNNNKNRNRRRRKKQCRKLGETCDDSRRKQQCCNSAQLCAQVPNLGSGNFCCKQLSQTCSNDNECCGRNRCRSGVCQTP